MIYTDTSGALCKPFILRAKVFNAHTGAKNFSDAQPRGANYHTYTYVEYANNGRFLMGQLRRTSHKPTTLQEKSLYQE